MPVLESRIHPEGEAFQAQRQAMLDANANFGADTIAFDPVFFNTPQTINLATPLPDITDALTINGPGADMLTITAHKASRVLNVIVDTTITINDLTLTEGNGVGYGDSNSAGAIRNTGTMTLNRCVISNSSVTNTGGAIVTSKALTMNDCYVFGNTATYAGGVYNFLYSALTITRSTFAQNKSTADISAGAVESTYGPLIVKSSTFSGNSSTGTQGGAGAIICGATASLTSCTITNNLASGPNSAGGVKKISGNLTVQNCIIAANQNPNTEPDVFHFEGGSFTSGGFNLIGNVGIVAGFNQPTDQIGKDPQLAPLGMYGGFAPTHTFLNTSSPAIDKGNSFGEPTEQRRFQRTVDLPAVSNATGGDGTDIGAIESRILTVTKVEDTNDGVCDGDCSLREAISVASASDQIQFASPFFNTPRTITLANPGLGSELVINKSVQINGPGADKLTISGEGLTRVLYVTAAGNGNIANVTLNHGNGSSSYSQGFGGCVLNEGTLSLTNSVVKNSTSNIDGGGIYSVQGTLILTGCTVTNNLAYGDNVGGGIASFGTLRAYNSTISGNRVLNDGAGGLWSSGIVELTNCTITDNSVGESITNVVRSAKGVENHYGQFTARNTIIAGNRGDASIPDVYEGYAGIIGSLGYNLIGNVGTDTRFTQTGDQTGTGSAVLDPKLGPLQMNGGPTPTHALLPNSPALDQGNSFGLTTDQRNQPRPTLIAGLSPAIGGDRSDIGAFEAQLADLKHLVFSVQPNDTVANGVISPAVKVQLLDSNNNLVNSNADVTLAVGANPGSGTLGGTVTVAAVNGTATFNTLSLNKSGSGYTLSASSPNFLGASSSPFNITCPTITVKPDTGAIAAGTVGRAYSQQFSQTGIAGVVTWSINPAIPGLSIDATGKLSGTPTAINNYSFTVQATDANGCSGSTNYTLVIGCPAIDLTPTTLPSGAYNSPYPPTTLTPTSGTAPYQFTVTGLPSGMGFNTTSTSVTISGTPAQLGSFTVVVKASDGYSCNNGSNGRSYSLVVNPATTILTWNNPADIVYGIPLSTAQLNATANVPGNFSYTPALGALLNAGSGKTLSVTFTPNDTVNYVTTTKTVFLNVLKAPLTVTPNNVWRNLNEANPPLTGTIGGLVNGDVITASYSTAAAMNSAAGTYPITATLNDPGLRLGNYQVTSNIGTLTIVNNCGITINPATFAPATLAVSYAQPLTVSPAGASTFSLLAGALPTGLQLVNTAGNFTLQGTPIAPGTYNFTIKAQPSGSTCYAVRNYTMTIAPSVVPVVNCMTYNANGSITVWYGYTNTTGSVVTIPISYDNYFSPWQMNMGQVVTFQVGTVTKAFSVTYANVYSFVGWSVKGPDGVIRMATPTVLSPTCP